MLGQLKTTDSLRNGDKVAWNLVLKSIASTKHFLKICEIYRERPVPESLS